MVIYSRVFLLMCGDVYYLISIDNVQFLITQLRYFKPKLTKRAKHKVTINIAILQLVNYRDLSTCSI